MNDRQEPRKYPSAAIAEQTAAILRGWGLHPDDVAATADALLDADLRGIDTHGIALLPLYATWIKAGKFDFGTRPKIVREGPAYAVIDAGAALGIAVSVAATRLAVAKAAQSGIATVSVVNSHHFGAAGYYARMAARAGMISMVTTSTRVICVVPPNGAEPVLGTNPLAFAVPRRGSEPIALDMATSTAAGNRIRVFHLRDQPLPAGWVVDGKGNPVTDPHEGYRIIYEGSPGGLTPLGASLECGSAKGYGLALMVHLLSATLVGGAFPPTRRKTGNAEPDNIGHMFLTISPAMFRDGDDFAEDVEEVVHTLRASRPTDPARPVLVPGDIEERVHEARLRDGIPLPAALVGQLRDLATQLGVSFGLG